MDVSWGSLDMDNNGKVAILDEISKSMMGIEVPDNDCLMSQLVIYLIMLRIACQGYKRIILPLVRDINFLKRCFCCKGSGKFLTQALLADDRKCLADALKGLSQVWQVPVSRRFAER